MMNRIARGAASEKMLRVAAAFIALAAPMAAGLLNPPPGSAQAQVPNAASPKFEVASVKPSRTEGSHGMDTQPGGRLTAWNFSLKMLIQVAFGIYPEDYRLVGLPGGLGAERYDIDAKTAGPHPQKIGNEELRPLLQTLLLDRFALKFHREAKEMSVYSLVVAKNGPRLVEHTGPVHSSDNANPGSIIATKTTISILAKDISMLLARPVVDNTGIKGEFDFRLAWTPEQTAPPPMSDVDAGADLFSALQEQLGLRLESAKGPVEVIVVDHVERPSEN